jgi:hypothetical protein
MNCYVCDNEGRVTSAVATCHHCGAALCREHLDDDLLSPRGHGHIRQHCTHDLVHSAQARRRSRSSASSHA